MGDIKTAVNSSLSKQSLISVSKEQVSCTLDGDQVILNLKDGMYYELNQVGARIWDLLQKPQTVHEIVQIIQDEYEVNTEECEKDSLDLLQQLASKDLIEIRDAKTS